MSERGSFVTEYIYCKKCLEAAKEVLLDNHKYLCSRVIGGWGVFDLPIIAGKIGGLYAGEALHDFEAEYLPSLEALICHPMRVAVLAEAGQKIFTATPLDNRKQQE